MFSGNYGEPIEFEWKNFPRFTSISILRKIQVDLKVPQINPEKVEGIISLMSMFNDTDWTKNGNSTHRISNSKEVRDYAKRFQRGHWSFFGPGNEDKWYGTYSHKPKGKWNNEANQMIKHFEESGHPIFRGTSALNRGILRRTEGRKATHFTAESVSIEPLLRTIHSANQLSIYGAVSSWCDELAEQMPGQTSLGVDKYISKVNDPLSKQLDPQEVGSLVQTEDR